MEQSPRPLSARQEFRLSNTKTSVAQVRTTETSASDISLFSSICIRYLDYLTMHEITFLLLLKSHLLESARTGLNKS